MHRRHSSPPVLVLVLLLALPAVLAAQGGPRAGRGGPSDGLRIWWNQPQFVESMQLEEEQRKRMDAILQETREARREAATAYRAARMEMTKAAHAGDWKAAEEASARVGNGAAELARLDSEMVIAVLRILQPEQREKLDEHPMILRRPWLLGGMGGRGRR